MYELVSFVSRGKIRSKILKNLISPNTPTKLSIIIKTHISTISRAILALEKKGLVSCITPHERMDRYYQITKAGKRILLKLRGH